MRSMTEEAACCRKDAQQYVGRPEQPFLLRLADAFEDLALISRTPLPPPHAADRLSR
jgi:hypothetical protein